MSPRALRPTEEIGDAFEALAANDSAAAVILTGKGKAFCAGLDLKAIPRYSQEESHALYYGVEVGVVTGISSGILVPVAPAVESWIDNLPDRRLGVTGPSYF